MRPIRFFQGLDLSVVELHLQRRDGFFEMLHLASADNGRRNAGLLQNPRERDLRVGQTPLPRDLSEALDHREVRLLIVELVRVFVGLRADRFAAILLVPVSRQKAARQRTPRNYTDPPIAAQWNHFPLFFAIDQVVVILHA